MGAGIHAGGIGRGGLGGEITGDGIALGWVVPAKAPVRSSVAGCSAPWGTKNSPPGWRIGASRQDGLPRLCRWDQPALPPPGEGRQRRWRGGVVQIRQVEPQPEGGSIGLPTSSKVRFGTPDTLAAVRKRATPKRIVRGPQRRRKRLGERNQLAAPQGRHRIAELSQRLSNP